MCTFLLQSDTLWDSSDASWDFWDGYIIAIHGMQFICQVFLNPRPVEQIQCKSLHACLCFILLPYNALNEHSLTSLNFTQAGQVIKLTVLFFVVLRHWYDISKNSKSLNIPLSDFPKRALGFLLCIKFASSTVIAFFFCFVSQLMPWHVYTFYRVWVYSSYESVSSMQMFCHSGTKIRKMCYGRSDDSSRDNMQNLDQ